MNLQIRDPRARDLAKRIAQRRHVSMTDAVIDALEAEYRRVSAAQPLAARLGAIAGGAGSHHAACNEAGDRSGGGGAAG